MQNKKLLYLIVLLLGEIGYIATDIYLPSMPAIAKSFAAHSTSIQLTITVYLFGFGYSQLLYGPLSDSYGRRLVVLGGLMIITLASLLCTLAPSIDLLILARFLQGAGAGSGTVMARAIMSDLFTNEELAKAGSYYAMIAAQLLAVMPIIGGYTQILIGWRANFGFILLYSLTTLILAWRYLPETSHKKALQKLKIKLLLHRYFTLIQDKNFMGCALLSSFALAGLIAYASINPFIFQNVLHLTPIQNGWLSLVGCSAFILSSFANTRLVDAFGIANMIVAGALLMLAGGLVLLAISILVTANLIGLLISSFIFTTGTNWIFSNAAAKALSPLATIAGTAGALFGTIQIVIASLISGIVAVLKENNQLSLGIIFCGIGILTCCIYFLLLRARNELDPSPSMGEGIGEET